MLRLNRLKLVALATDKFVAEVANQAKDNAALRIGNKRPNPPPLAMEVRPRGLIARVFPASLRGATAVVLGPTFKTAAS